MSGVSKLASADVSNRAKDLLLSMGKTSYVAVKLQAVISAKDHGIQTVADIFGVTRPTVTAWIKHVKEGSFDRLTVAPGRGRKPKLSPEQLQKVEEWIQSSRQVTSQRLSVFVKDTFDISISTATAHRIIKSLGFSYMTPRPRHYKADKVKGVEFKKN
jgi:transposase